MLFANLKLYPQPRGAWAPPHNPNIQHVRNSLSNLHFIFFINYFIIIEPLCHSPADAPLGLR